MGYAALAGAAMAEGNAAALRDATEAWPRLSALPQWAAVWRVLSAVAALAGGDLVAARRWAEEAVTGTTGYHLSAALLARAQVAIAQGEPEQGERDARDALACAADSRGLPARPRHPRMPRRSDRRCRQSPRSRPPLRRGSRHPGTHGRSPAQGLRPPATEASVAAVRDALGEKDFESAWAEGAALSVEEAIAYAQRGRGERKRAATGWGALTPAERDVVRLVSEGLGNKDIAARLFVSPRTVQSHLTHVYAKLNVTSRMQLAHEAARQRGHSDADQPRP